MLILRTAAFALPTALKPNTDSPYDDHQNDHISALETIQTSSLDAF